MKYSPNSRHSVSAGPLLSVDSGRRQFLQAAGAAAALSMAGPLAYAAPAYPNGPVHLVVPFSAGGATDILGRLFAKEFEKELASTVVVENRVGAAGAIGAQSVVRAAADGHTLLMGGVGTNIVLALTQPALAYDPVADLSPAAYLCNVDYVLAVAADSPFQTLDDLLNEARKRPGELSYMSTGPSGPLHVALEFLNKKAGTEMVHVPYKGEAPAYPDLITGRIDVATMTVPFTKPRIEDGSLRVLASISAQRAAAMPDVPTVAEQGFEGYAVPIWNGLFVPAGTPEGVIATIDKAANAVIQQEAMRQQMISMGVSPTGGSAAMYADFLETERARWKEMVEVTGVLKN